MAEMVARYDDLPLGTTAASLVALAERLGVDEIATLDHRQLPSRAHEPCGMVHASLRTHLLSAPHARVVLVSSARPSRVGETTRPRRLRDLSAR